MNGGKELDREKIEEAFRIMGQYLLERNALGEIAPVTAAVLSFSSSIGGIARKTWMRASSVLKVMGLSPRLPNRQQSSSICHDRG